MVYISANIHVHIGFLKLLSPDVISGVMVKNVLAGRALLTAYSWTKRAGEWKGQGGEGRGRGSRRVWPRLQLLDLPVDGHINVFLVLFTQRCCLPKIIEIGFFVELPVNTKK